MLMSVKLANLHSTVGWLPIQQVGDYVQVRTEVIASLGLDCMVYYTHLIGVVVTCLIPNQ